jgi:hypothetical protein
MRNFLFRYSRIVRKSFKCVSDPLIAIYKNSGRLYLLNALILEPPIWTKIDLSKVWGQIIVPNGDLDKKATSIPVLSMTPTLCQISSYDEVLPVLLLRKPIPSSARKITPKSNTNIANVLTQFSSSISTFGFLGKPVTSSSDQESMKGDTKKSDPLPPTLPSDKNIQTFERHINDVRFYSINLELTKLLDLDTKQIKRLSDLKTRFQNFVDSVSDSCHVLSSGTHKINSEILDSFLRGIIQHSLLSLHSSYVFIFLLACDKEIII